MSDLLDILARQIGYVLSLPERAVRSLAASVGGLSRLLTDQLFPSALRRSTSYRVFLGNAQRFLIESLGQVQGAYPAETGTPAGPEYVKRKLVGNAVEAAGMFAMHISPLWIFAVASDVLAGSKLYLHRLSDELKRRGLLEQSDQPETLDALLEGLQKTTQASARVFDLPPLSASELARLRDELVAGVTRMFEPVEDLLPRFDRIWGQMQQLARQEDGSLEAIGGLLSLGVARAAKWSTDGISAIGQTTAGLLGEALLDDYRRSLEQIARKGYWGYLQEFAKPYLAAVADHFDPDHPTWTETVLKRLTGK